MIFSSRFENLADEIVLSASEYSIKEVVKALNSLKKGERCVYDISNLTETEVRDNMFTIKNLALSHPQMEIKVLDIEMFSFIRENEVDNGMFLCFNDMNIATTPEQLHSLCEAGVSQAYIGGELGFNMDKVLFFKHKYGIRTRVIPNMATLTIAAHSTPHTKTSFWIRPEDLDLYNDYVDTVEFICADKTKEEVLLDIYRDSRKWAGNLKDLIANLEDDIPNSLLVRDFTKARLNCGKKCLIDRCHFCDKFAALAVRMRDNDLDLEFNGE